MVILFDGVCNLCNGFIQFVLKRDKKQEFQFASLQSTYGIALLNHLKLPTDTMETVIVFDGQKIFTESDAVLKIVHSFGGLWKCTTIFSLIPRFIRNGVYRLVAKNRYKLFGKRDQCMVPTEDMKGRFVDNEGFIPHRD